MSEITTHSTDGAPTRKARKSAANKTVLTEVRKRDGTIVPFDRERIKSAIYRAMLASREGSEEDAERVTIGVVSCMEKEARQRKEYLPTVEDVQDVVETELIFKDFAKTAKGYIIYREAHKKIREQTGVVPERVKELARESKKYFRNSLAEFVYYRSYSRWIYHEGRRETWIETVDRYIAFMKENLGKKLHDKEYEELREGILAHEAMPSMRLMWSAGAAARKTNVCAYNCSFIAPSKLRDFGEIMYLSMCGTGVGFSVESQTVQQLPQIKKQSGRVIKTHVIGDSKEGWADAFVHGMETWFGGDDLKFDYSQLRPAGARLATMGGKSSGPDPLRALIDFSREKVLRRQGRRLSNLDVHDIVCKIGEVVVSGGVRRSALISLSDLDDYDMRHAKDGQFYMTEPQRMMANNSAVYVHRPATSEFMDEWIALMKSGSGERGIFNRGGLQSHIPERRKKAFLKDIDTCGTNPCVTKDTWVMTANGALQVGELLNVPFQAVVNGKVHHSEGFFKTGDKEVFRVNTFRGFSFTATANHQVLVVNYKTRKVQHNVWKEVKDLRRGDRVVLHDHDKLSWSGKGTRQEGWLLGNLYGDGNIEKDQKANLDYWGVNKELMMKRAVTLVHGAVGGRSNLTGHISKTGYARVGSVALGTLAASYGMVNSRKLPEEKIEKTSSVFYEGFLQGWFDADGSVQGNQFKGVSIRLSANSIPALQTAQRMLARLGVIATIYTNRRGAQYRKLPDGRGGIKSYFCQPNHELIIHGANIARFRERVGFSDPEKQAQMERLFAQYKRALNEEPFSAEVTTIEKKGREEVFDCTVPVASAFDGNGVYLHNCGEIILKSKQFCNLTEVVVRSEDTKASLLSKVRLATILGTYQSTLTNFKYLSKEWKKNCEAECLLGVSLTGQWDNPSLVHDPKTLRELREEAVATNKLYAKRFGVNQSTAVTCVKPSGTVSQLVDAASGMHPRHARFYIRRIRISATDGLFKMLRDQGIPFNPEVGQSAESAVTYVIDFPVKAPPGSVFKNDVSAFKQLTHWKLIKEHYTEHNPSVTVSVGEDEWLLVASWLYENWDMIGGLSFLPRGDHVYQLAPFEEITEERHGELVKRWENIDFSKIVSYEKIDETQGAKELACVSGTCEL